MKLNYKINTRFFGQRIFLLLVIVFFLSIETCLAISVDVRGEYENWNSGLGGTSTALLGGIGGSQAINKKLSIGGGFVLGNYDNTSASSTDISRLDFDLTASYLIKPLVSVYTGYQLIQLNYTNNDDDKRSFNDTLHGLGIGAVYYHPLKLKWLAYGGIGFSGVYATTTLKGKSADRGTGISSSFNVGILYSVSKELSIASGIKSRRTSVDYGDGSGKWAHNATRFVVSLSRQW